MSLTFPASGQWGDMDCPVSSPWLPQSPGRESLASLAGTSPGTWALRSMATLLVGTGLPHTQFSDRQNDAWGALSGTKGSQGRVSPPLMLGVQCLGPRGSRGRVSPPLMLGVQCLGPRESRGGASPPSYAVTPALSPCANPPLLEGLVSANPEPGNLHPLNPPHPHCANRGSRFAFVPVSGLLVRQDACRSYGSSTAVGLSLPIKRPLTQLREFGGMTTGVSPRANHQPKSPRGQVCSKVSLKTWSRINQT